MNFLKKIKALFSKDKEEVKKLESEVGIERGPECYWCEGTIDSNEKKKTFNGRKFHIQCYRIMIKQAKSEMGFK